MNLQNILIVNTSEEQASNKFGQRINDRLFELESGSPEKRIYSPYIQIYFTPGYFWSSAFDAHFKNLDDKPHPILKNQNIYICGIPDLEERLAGLNENVRLTSDAAKANGAKKTVAVLPFLPFSRADKNHEHFKKGSREWKNNIGRGISLELQAREFATAYVDQIITLDIHSQQGVEIFKKAYKGVNPIINLSTLPIFAHYTASGEANVNLKDQGSHITVISPDNGAKERTDEFVYNLRYVHGLKNVSVVYLDKKRGTPNNPDDLVIKLNYVSDNFKSLDANDCIIPDDIGDTMGTMAEAIKLIKSGKIPGLEGQIPNSVNPYITHPVFKWRAYKDPMQKLETTLDLDKDELVLFDTHPTFKYKLSHRLERVTTFLRSYKLIAQAIYCLEEDIPIENIYKTNGNYDPFKIAFLCSIDRKSYHSKRNHNS